MANWDSAPVVAASPPSGAWDGAPIHEDAAPTAEPVSGFRKFMGSMQTSSPRWDVPGDIGREAVSSANAVGANIDAAFPSPHAFNAQQAANREKYGPVLGTLKGAFIDPAVEMGHAAMVPMSALGVLASPVTGALHATLGSALSYITPHRPGEDPKAIADAAIDTALSGMRPGSSGAGLPGIERFSAEEAAARKAAGLTNKAVDRINERVAQDIKGGGTTAQDIIDRLNDAKAQGKPVALADVAGENTQALLGNVARQPGPARATVTDTLTARDEAAGGRVREDINQGLARGSAFEAKEILDAIRKKDAAPLYEKFNKAAPINPDEVGIDEAAPSGSIGSLMKRPSMRKATQNALNIAAEEGRDPAALGLAFNEAGDPIFQRVPSWQTLDYIKRGLDDVIEADRDKTSGKLVLDTGGRAANNTRAEYVNAIDRLNPAYKEARDAYAGPSQSKDAIEWGKDFMGLEPEEIADRFKRLSPNDQEFARLGVAQTLRKMVSKTGKAGDETRRLIGNQYIRDQLRPMFGSQQGYDRFVKSLQMESDMFDTHHKTLRNSLTAARFAEDAHGPMIDALGHGAHAATHAASGNMLSALASAYRARRDVGLIQNPAVNSEVARLLLDPNIQVGSGTGQLLKRLPMPETRNFLARALLSGSIGAPPALVAPLAMSPPQSPPQ